jgi:hypothetical protein
MSFLGRYAPVGSMSVLHDSDSCAGGAEDAAATAAEPRGAAVDAPRDGAVDAPRDVATATPGDRGVLVFWDGGALVLVLGAALPHAANAGTSAMSAIHTLTLTVVFLAFARSLTGAASRDDRLTRACMTIPSPFH